jgi:hypothetical protein
MLNENTIQGGKKYKVIGHSLAFLNRADDGLCPAVGSIGICKWVNYRGACLKFPDGLGYVVPFDCLGEVDDKPRLAFRSVPTLDTIVCNQFRYRVAKLPNEGIQLLGKIGKLCKIVWASGVMKIAEIEFEDGEKIAVYLEMLEDVGC